MGVFWFVWRLFTPAAEAALAWFLLKGRLAQGGAGARRPVKPLAGALALFMALWLAELLFLPEWAALAVQFCLGAGYALLAFDGPLAPRVVWGCAGGLLPVAARTLALAAAAGLFAYGDNARAWLPGAGAFYRSALALMLQALLTLVAANIGRRPGYRLTPGQLAALAGLCGLCVYAVSLQTQVAATLSVLAGTHAAQRALVRVSLCILLVLAALVWLADSLGRGAQQLMEQNLELQQVRLEQDHYRQLGRSAEALRGLKHDLKTHLQVMRGLLEAQDSAALRAYFDQLEEQYKREAAVFATGDRALDAVLTAKQVMAAGDGVALQLYSNTAHRVPLDPVKLCALVGNLVDNGVEACRKLPAGPSRQVRLTVGEKGEMLYIKAENGTDGQYRWAGGRLGSTKPGAGHGLGLQRVRRIAEEAGGFLDIEPGPDRFTAVVMLPLREGGQAGG